MNISRRHILGIAGALSIGAMLTGAPSAAVAWEPTKPIDFIIMAGKGGGADKMARLMQAIVEQENFPIVRLFPSISLAVQAQKHWSQRKARKTLIIPLWLH